MVPPDTTDAVATNWPVASSVSTLVTWAGRTTQIPSWANTRCSAWETSGSSFEASRDRTNMVTFEPSRANNWACSMATYPPPRTSIDSGTSFSSIAVVEVR